jgi:hypothetical protein
MSNAIVTVNVSVITAPTPITLQSTGAFISQGGTTLAANASKLLTQLSDLTSVLQGGVACSLAQSAGVATATLDESAIASGTYNSTTGLVTLTLEATVGLNPGNLVAISGLTGTGSYAQLDGTWACAAGTSGTTLTYYATTGLTLTITNSNTGTVQATTGLNTGVQFWTTISGATPAAYNGTFLATVASSSTFTYAVPSGTSSPATGSPLFTPPSVVELTQMATTFFEQGGSQGVYVLELGAGTASAGATALSTYISNNPNAFYIYLVPRSWDGVSSFLSLIAQFEALTGQTYFFTTTTLATYSDYTAAMKSVLWMVEAPGIPNTEFSLAAALHVALSYNPSPTDQVTPFAFSYLYGVTPYPTFGNGPTLAAIKTAGGNYVGTGYEGGIATSILFWGSTADGNDFSYWYSIDWVQENVNQAISNAIINGSNNPTNPIYYNQQGINTLQSVAAGVMAAGVSNGLVLYGPLQVGLSVAQLNINYNNGAYTGQSVVNAVPFLTYVTLNPNDFPIGKYAGFTIIFTPNRGFKAIVFNVLVNNLPAG